ncbi:hypothetical protein CBS101457_004637 [Exobasidium rhododendri]|nr:hypothetical protein CBS101457_004637 [Exobasidium rhododendri]
MDGWSPPIRRAQTKEAVLFLDKRPLTPPSSPPILHRRQLSRSPSSSQALPYHRPWNKDNGPSSIEALPFPPRSTQRSPSKQDAMTTYSTFVPDFNFAPSDKGAVIKQVSDYAPQNGAPFDFRVSTMNTNLVSKPAAKTMTPKKSQVVNAGRRTNRKKGKAPTDFNLMVAGGKMTGKTSWIRTLLSTIDLSQCTEETKIGASYFGVHSSSAHATRQTDPITPLSTNSIHYLGGMELHPGSLLPLTALEQGNVQQMVARMQSRNRPASTATSSKSSFGTSTDTGKLRLSVCDTPGIDFEVEDDFEVDRSATRLVKYVEEKMAKTLSEEGKVQRRVTPENHVHLVLYFIDPRHLVERTASRRKNILEARHGKSEMTKSRGKMDSLSNGRHHDMQDEDWTEGNESCVEGLSTNEINVIARLSRLANVLPIIAKADTLTETRLLEVRQAVRSSLKEAGVDLGVFDFAESEKNASNKKGDSDAASDDGNGSFDEQDEPVKVIKTRRGRTFSTAGSMKRPSVPEFGSLRNNKQGSDDSYGAGLPTSTSSSNEDEEEQGQSKGDLLRMIPFAIFVPEPSRPTHRNKKSFSSRGAYNNDDFDNHIPPVPALPRGISSDTNSISDMLEKYVSERDFHQEIGGGINSLSSHSSSLLLPPRLPTTLTGSSRYRRDFRWGSANVLDPHQCDFGLLRTAILGTQLDELRESTVARYENFRSKRLELNRVLRETQTRLEQKQ